MPIKYALLTIPFLTFSASAQAPHCCGGAAAVTPGWSYYGFGNGPYINASPGTTRGYGSFWLNGMSLHGPSIPTYGPTPEILGGPESHHRYYARPPLGWFGVYAASPRPKPPTVDVHPEAGAHCLTVRVSCPQDAAVKFGDAGTTSTGPHREFASPPLAAGRKYEYTVTATWDGKTETKVVQGQAGDTLTVEFK